MATPQQPGGAGGASASGGAGASGAAPPPTVGFDGVQQPPQQPALGLYPPISDAKPQGPAGGYPQVAPVSQQLPPGFPGAGAPPPGYGGPNAVVGMPVGPGGFPAGGPEDKIGPMGIIAWSLFVVGIFFPFTWVVCCFLPICAVRAAKGPKDLMAVRRAAISSSIALCFYMVLVVIFVSVGSSSWRRRVCIDKFGNRYYCA